MNKVWTAIASVILLFGAGVPLPSGLADTSTKTWNFSADRPNGPPAGFLFATTGSGRPGRWVVLSSAEAGGNGKVLAQSDNDPTDYRYPMAIANSPVLRDLRLSVRCVPVGGKVDRACGIVFRFLDEKNYYVARANALEDNVRLYRVKNGRREEFGSWDGKVNSGTWHELRADARGDRIEVYWDGKKVIDARDGTFADAGKVGVWTKADSVTYFKDLQAGPPGP